MYEVRKTEQGRFAIRPENAAGLFVLGTGLILDSHSSNIVVCINKEDAFQQAIKFNRSVSELFDIFIDKEKSAILDELENQNSIISECKKNIDVLNSVLHCKNRIEKK